MMNFTFKISINKVSFISILVQYLQKRTKKQSTGKQRKENRYTLNIVNIPFIDTNEISQTLKLTLFKLKRKTLLSTFYIPTS